MTRGSRCHAEADGRRDAYANARVDAKATPTDEDNVGYLAVDAGSGSVQADDSNEAQFAHRTYGAAWRARPGSMLAHCGLATTLHSMNRAPGSSNSFLTPQPTPKRRTADTARRPSFTQSLRPASSRQRPSFRDCDTHHGK